MLQFEGDSIMNRRGGEVMFKLRFANVLAAAGICGMLLSACSGEPPVDPELIEMTLTTEPETAAAGSQLRLQAIFEGIDIGESAEVTFDFRIGDKLELVEAERSGNSFSSTFTFPEKGIQTVYVHLYEGDLHITKKKWVEVK